VRVGAFPFDPFAEPYYGKGAGIFARAGFDLQISALANGGAVSAALAGGALDVGIGDLVTGVTAIGAGLPVVLLAAASLYKSTDDSALILVLKESPVRGARDLAGKTMAVPTLVGQTSVATKAWLAQNGLSADSVKFVEMGQGASYAALQRGQVDATLLVEPSITPVRSTVRDIGHPFDAFAKEFVFGAWYANRAWFEADVARTKRIIAAIYDTARWANDHRTETMAMLVEAGKYDPDRIRNIARSTFATSLQPALVQPVLNLAAQYKAVDKVYDAAALVPKL
jgi:NitT/TauT family transport system substrate-binding protein